LIKKREFFEAEIKENSVGSGTVAVEKYWNFLATIVAKFAGNCLSLSNNRFL
jgi:hypothetical protein